MLIIDRVTEALAKPFMPALFFLAGVTYDTVTLTRIDRLLDNLIILIYLSLLGVLIVLTGRAALEPPEASSEPPSRLNVQHLLARSRPYYVYGIQFLLGGLFSAYTIFYLQSSSLTTAAIFFGVLVAFLIANEFLRTRLSSLRLLVSLYAVVCFSFFTYFLPVLTGFMNTFVFLVGAVLSLGVVLWVVRLVYRKEGADSRRERILTGLPAAAVLTVFVGFYFLNWIPPVPLSLKFGGMYHQVDKSGAEYQLSYNKPAWYEFWKRSDNPFSGSGPAYCFTAVFAPVDLDTRIYHHWQYRVGDGASTERYETSDRIKIVISGGRQAGYRAYTMKRRVSPGAWRVDVETEGGRVIGRVNFTVEQGASQAPKLETILY